MGTPDFDAVAAVVDNHTGRVRAQFQGLGAEEDARSFLRQTQRGPHPVDILHSASVITGVDAKKAIRNGRT